MPPARAWFLQASDGLNMVVLGSGTGDFCMLYGEGWHEQKSEEIWGSVGPLGKAMLRTCEFGVFCISIPLVLHSERRWSSAILHLWRAPGTSCGQGEREALSSWHPAAFSFKTKKDGLDMLSPDCTVQLYLTWAVRPGALSWSALSKRQVDVLCCINHECLPLADAGGRGSEDEDCWIPRGNEAVLSWSQSRLTIP